MKFSHGPNWKIWRRGQLGAAYSPTAVYDGAWFLKDYGYLMAMTDAKPDQTQALQNNGAWLHLLVAPEIDPATTEFLRRQIELMQTATPAHLQQMAQKYLVENRAWKSIALPD